MMNSRYLVVVDRENGKEVGAWYDTRDVEKAYKEARFQRKHGREARVYDTVFWDIKMNGFKVLEIKERG